MENMQKFEIYYIRHADTSGAPCEDRCNCDVGLSELGEEQIKLIAKRFKGKSFDAILSSPLVRCVKTAAAVANSVGKPVIEIIPELMENGTLPDYSGPDIDYLKRYYSNIKLCDDVIMRYYSTRGDRANDIRAKKVVEYLKNRFSFGQRILVVSHGSFGNHFIPATVEMGKGNYILSISNTSVTKIKYTSDGKQRISFMNDISHLRPIMNNYEFDT